MKENNYLWWGRHLLFYCITNFGQTTHHLKIKTHFSDCGTWKRLMQLVLYYATRYQGEQIFTAAPQLCKHVTGGQGLTLQERSVVLCHFGGETELVYEKGSCVVLTLRFLKKLYTCCFLVVTKTLQAWISFAFFRIKGVLWLMSHLGFEVIFSHGHWRGSVRFCLALNGSL